MTSQPTDAPLLGTAEMKRTSLCLVMEQKCSVFIGHEVGWWCPHPSQQISKCSFNTGSVSHLMKQLAQTLDTPAVKRDTLKHPLF